MARVSDCLRCPLACTRTNIAQPRGGVGVLGLRAILVGEGPGRDEDEQGVAFVGRSGKLLNRALEAAGIDPNDCFITNVVRCRPPENRVPTPHEQLACRPYLLSELQWADSAPIVALGRTAQAALDAAGIPHGNAWHPAFVLRGGDDRFQEFVEQLREAICS